MTRFRTSCTVAFIVAGLAITSTSCSSSPGTSSNSNAGPSNGSNSNTGGSSNTSLLSEIIQRGVVRLGVIPVKPFMYLDPTTNTWHGAYIDLIKDWAALLHVSIEYHPTTFATVIAALQARQIDIAAGITETAARAVVVDFSNPTWTEVQAVAINPANTSATNWQQFNNSKYTACVVLGSSEDSLITANPGLIHFKVTKLPDQSSCRLDVTSGRTNGYFSDWLTNGGFVAANKGLKLIFADSSVPTLQSGTDAILKGYNSEDTLQSLNAEISAFQGSGAFAAAAKAAGAVNPIGYAADPASVPSSVAALAAQTFGQ